MNDYSRPFTLRQAQGERDSGWLNDEPDLQPVAGHGAGALRNFVPFAVLFMNQPLKVDYLYAGLCLMGAVYFKEGLIKSHSSFPLKYRHWIPACAGMTT